MESERERDGIIVTWRRQRVLQTRSLIISISLSGPAAEADGNDDDSQEDCVTPSRIVVSLRVTCDSANYPIGT